MENLPSEVLSEIFIRLLAKQLAQMRCICKPWNALLSECSFVNSHLRRSIHHNNEILLLFRNERYDSSFTARPSRSPNLELTNIIKLPVNLRHEYSVHGSVNGLICFSYRSDPDDYVVGFWNPSLSAMLTLPPRSMPALKPGWSRMQEFGFGIDPKTDDYKVVICTTLFKRIKTRRIISQIEVYNMRLGSWESISSHIAMFGNQNNVCVHDHLHWLGSTYSMWKPEMIRAFDLGAETFNEIPLPDSILHHRGYHFIVLGVLAGMLCVMPKLRDGGCEVWVMYEYGSAESWAKHHAFSQLSGDIFPYGFTSYNEFLFEVDDCFALYDPVTTMTKTFKIMPRTPYYKSKIVEYVDSLVWIGHANQLPI